VRKEVGGTRQRPHNLHRVKKRKSRSVLQVGCQEKERPRSDIPEGEGEVRFSRHLFLNVGEAGHYGYFLVCMVGGVGGGGGGGF